MKKYLLLLLVALCSIGPLNARECGQNRANEPYRYRVTCKVLNVRNAPQNGRVLFTLRANDIVYGTPVPANTAWLKISGDEKWYVSTKYLAKEVNPYYSDTSKEEDIYYSSAKTLHLQMIARWCLLVFCVLAFLFLLYWKYGTIVELFENSTQWRVAGKTMHQKFYFGISSYLSVLLITGLIVGGIVAGIAGITAVGGAVWLVMAILYVILWALVIVGWIALVIGILGLFSDEKGPSFICAVVGGIIVGWSDGIVNAGERALNAGFSFFRNLYIIDFARDLCFLYWKPALMIAAFPLAVFLCFTLLNILIAGVFKLVEYLVMRHYNIKNPCPICHHASEPAVYLSDGIDLPVKLHPGKFGIFRIRHPDTGHKMPTMLFNGKDRLERKCHHCGAVIAAKMGTEKHVALAGVAESGKTTLVYRLIAELKRQYPESVKFTDTTDTNMTAFVDRVARMGCMTDFPEKTPIGVLRSIQLLIRRHEADKIAYRLYLNDVGGELYDLAGVDKSKSKQMGQFVRTVETVLFLVDPITTEFDTDEVSPQFKAWLAANQNESIEKIDITNAFRRLKELFAAQKISKKKLRKINFDIVLVKRDLGYLSGIDADNEDALKGFLLSDMCLQALMSDIEATFAPERIRIIAVSASSRNESGSNMEPFSHMILEQAGIDMQP